MNSPGLFDPQRSQEEISADIVRAVACTHPGPHAILYVIRLDQYTEKEFSAYKRLKTLFDDNLVKYMIVIFAGGDDLEAANTSIQEELKKAPESLIQVLEECNHRYVVFNNMAKETRAQVELLFQEVHKVMALNGDRPYTCPKYTAVGLGLEEEVARRLAEVEGKNLEKTKYVQELKRKVRAIEEAAEKEEKLLEQEEKKREEKLKQLELKAEEKLQSLKRKMEEQRLSAENQQEEEEERRLLKETSEERERQLQEFQKQREADTGRLAQKQKELEAVKLREHDLEREVQEYKNIHAETMRKVKSEIAEKEDLGFLGTKVKPRKRVRHLVEGVKSFFK
nr:hypothetical protein BaRGS_009228 [Batillaria attramentaria]